MTFYVQIFPHDIDIERFFILTKLPRILAHTFLHDPGHWGHILCNL